jgi:hypothetical protein
MLEKYVTLNDWKLFLNCYVCIATALQTATKATTKVTTKATTTKTTTTFLTKMDFSYFSL